MTSIDGLRSDGTLYPHLLQDCLCLIVGYIDIRHILKFGIFCVICMVLISGEEDASTFSIEGFLPDYNCIYCDICLAFLPMSPPQSALCLAS